MTPPKRGEPPRVPWQQVLLDDVFLLLFLGVGVPVVLYIVWGLIELANLPVIQ